MGRDSFFFKVINEHSEEFFGKADKTHPLTRIHSHMHNHLKNISESISTNNQSSGTKRKEGLLETIIENANIVVPRLNQYYYSYAGSKEINQMPIIDNHCHVGLLETRMNAPEGFTFGKLLDFFEIVTALSLLSPEEGRELWSIYHSEENKDVKLYLSRKKIKDECENSMDNYRSTALWDILAKSFTTLYPGASSEEEIETKIAEQRQMGLNSSYTQILDKSNIKTAVCMRRNLDPVWDKQRFKLIVEFDPFMNVDLNDTFFQSTLKEMGIENSPDNFDDYISFLDKMINYFKEDGAVAVKIHAAYVRPIFFQKRSREEAEQSFKSTYSKNKAGQGSYRNGRVMELDEYCQTEENQTKRPFQDFAARRMLELCGGIDMPVQFHTGAGFLPGMEFKNSSPLNLENIVRDPVLRKTKVVVLHGGYPFFEEAVSLAKVWKNVYLDISCLTYMFNFSLSRRLTECIEYLPQNKILFGSDAVFPELFHAAAQNGRKQLSMALENLVGCNSLSANKAGKIAESILSGNAKKLYGL